MSGPAPLQTARLWLDPLGPQHLDALAALDADPAVMRHILGRPRSRAETRANYEKQYANPAHAPGLGAWAVFEHGRDDFVGVGLLKPLDGRPEIEVGYRFYPHVWGRGYATEVARRLLAHGFDDLGLNAIDAVVHPDNAASQAVVEKAGLMRIGVTAAYGSQGLIHSRLTRPAWQAAR